MSSQEFQRKMDGFAHASALLLQTMTKTIRKLPTQFNEGMTPKEIELYYHRLAREGDVEKISITTFENKVRYLFYKAKTAGKHKVPKFDGSKLNMRIHYFPLGLDEEGLINHARCKECKKP